MREEGIDKYKADHSSAFIEFKSLNCSNFLTRDHQIRNQLVSVREFVYDDRQSGDDWNAVHLTQSFIVKIVIQLMIGVMSISHLKVAERILAHHQQFRRRNDFASKILKMIPLLLAQS